MINIYAAPIIFKDDYLKLEKYEKDIMNTRKCPDGHYKLKEMFDEPYYILDEIVNYVKKYHYDKKYEYLFIINKIILEEDDEIDTNGRVNFKYEVYVANIHFPHLSMTKGSITINSTSYAKDIKKLNYVFDMIELFLSKDSKDISYLVISSLDEDEIKDKLLFDTYTLMPLNNLKTMLLKLSLVTDSSYIIKKYIMPIALMCAVLFGTDIYFKSIKSEYENSRAMQTKAYRKVLKEKTSKNTALLKKIDENKEYAQKDIHK